MSARNSEKPKIAIIPVGGTAELVNSIVRYLREIYMEDDIKIIDVELVRFATGDAKAVLGETVRGMDVYIVVDVGNYDCSYQMFGRKTYMSPDDHFQDLKRVVSAIGGKASRINVIMPLLYSARQDRRIKRESLDCAVALKELSNMGVDNIMSFDVHDSRVQNAIPFTGFDNLMPTYQVIKAIVRTYPDIRLCEDEMVVVSPDIGGSNRNLFYANELGLEMGLFYKRRSRDKIVNGKYPVEVHKYIGPDLKDKVVLICDDILASGETVLDVSRKIKELGAKKVLIAVTFGFFTEGIEKFNAAYSQKVIDAVFITNASYLRDEIVKEKWFKKVDISKYIAYYIYCIHCGKSISNIMDPHMKIHSLLVRHGDVSQDDDEPAVQ